MTDIVMDYIKQLLGRVEKLENNIRQMYKENPNICPHDYTWTGTIPKTNKRIYKCNLCGKELISDGT